MLAPFIILLHSAQATSPMPVIFETAEPGLRVWWRHGDLLVGPPDGDPRPAIRPLAGRAPLLLTSDMKGWTSVGPGCSALASAEFSLDHHQAHAHWMPPWTSPSVEVRVGTEVLSSAPLSRPIEPCALVAANVDELPGLELLVLWQMKGNHERTTGLTVLRIPPAASEP